MTTRHVALLRGVNIGRRRMPMADLRDCLTGLGLDDVSTYLQSGNAVFGTESPDRGRLAREIERALYQRFGFEVPVILRTGDEIRSLVERCPFRETADHDPTKVHVMFLEPMPPPQVWEALSDEDFHPEEVAPGRDAFYIHLPEGMARSKLPAILDRAVAPSVATTRNWRTVLNLAEMGR